MSNSVETVGTKSAFERKWLKPPTTSKIRVLEKRKPVPREYHLIIMRRGVEAEATYEEVQLREFRALAYVREVRSRSGRKS